MSEASPLPPPPLRIERALGTLGAWVAQLRADDIPVSAGTADTLAALAANEDAVDAHMLAEAIGDDPLMTLKLLAHVGTHSRRATDVETVTGALVLMGIGPFFRHFAVQASVESALADLPEALVGLRAALVRAHRAGRFALGFAVHRMDHDANVIQEAALLHNFAEMLLWCHAPQLALEIAVRQHTDPALRSSVAQRAVLGFALTDLQQALMKTWRLPELLIRLGDERHAAAPQVRNVMLAARLARHTALGWDNPALPDDVSDIAALLQLGEVPTLALLREIDD